MQEAAQGNRYLTLMIQIGQPCSLDMSSLVTPKCLTRPAIPKFQRHIDQKQLALPERFPYGASMVDNIEHGPPHTHAYIISVSLDRQTRKIRLLHTSYHKISQCKQLLPEPNFWPRTSPLSCHESTAWHRLVVRCVRTLL